MSEAVVDITYEDKEIVVFYRGHAIHTVCCEDGEALSEDHVFYLALQDLLFEDYGFQMSR
jgi:hypothetical protein